MKSKRLYKFLRTDLKSDYDRSQWKIGEWRTDDRDIELCKTGFHASKTPLQALGYVKGEILALVEVKGKSAIENDKETWSSMRIVKAWHWKKEDSVSLAIFAAEQVISIYEKKYPDDDRPRKAIQTAKEYLKDPTKKNAYAAYAAANAAKAAANAANAAYAANAANAAYAAYAAANAANAAYAAYAANAAYAAYAAKKTLIRKIDKWF
ncbi:MAG: hypothetical protein KGJ13_12190, partial [Patescibacteria group bacterium]|nr:hypothetical protein [Patescibacteria group bacterium]